MTDNEQDWLNKISSVLETRPDRIDPEVSARLAEMRRQAVSGSNPDRSTPVAIPVAVMATVCLVIAVLLYRPGTSSGTDEMINDLDVITTSDSLELIEDLEFYEWLEDYEFPS